jgi:hypothetical protein
MTAIGVGLLAGTLVATKTFSATPFAYTEPANLSRNDEKVKAAAVLSLAVERAYVEGEPIELKLTISNTSDHEVIIERGIPVFRKFIDGATVAFSRDGRELKPKPRSTNGQLWVGGGKSALVRLAPGDKVEVPLFLQRYCPQPSAGKHELAYTVKIGSPKVGDDVNPRYPHIAAEGKLAFTIEPRNEEKLKTVYQTLVKELDQDRWRSRAQEALVVAEDSVAIPYLIQACEEYRKYSPSPVGYSFFDALARFPDENQVRKFMADHITAGHEEYYTADAMGLLGEWKVELPVADVRRLLKAKEERVSKETLKYIRKMAPKYNELKP